MVSFQHGQEALFQAGFPRADGNASGTRLPRAPVQFFSPLNGAGNAQGAVLWCHGVTCRNGNPGHQLELRRLFGGPDQFTTPVHQVASLAVEHSLPLIEHD